MKTYLLIAILSFIQLSVFSQQIEFFNVGIQDKPLPYVIISMKKKPEGYFVKNTIVTSSVYNIIKQYIVDNNTHNQPIANNYHKDKNACSGNYDFGCYAVQITEKRGNSLYFMDTNEKTVKYFKGLVSFLNKKGITDVAEALQEIIVRIEFVDANGNTVQTGSATARTLMIGAIDHQDWVSVAPGKSGVLPGTNDIGLNIKQIDGFINGTVGMDNKTLGWGMTLMHELHHTQVGGGLRDTPGNPGPVVTQMNIIRSELGGSYGKRLDYYATPIGGNVFIPFNRSAMESIIIGLHPSLVRSGQQYIKY